VGIGNRFITHICKVKRTRLEIPRLFNEKPIQSHGRLAKKNKIIADGEEVTAQIEGIYVKQSPIISSKGSDLVSGLEPAIR
jgi:hypothetical protein